MADRQLAVNLYGEQVGVLTVRGHVTTFEFLDDYLDLPERPVLGQQFAEAPRTRWRQAHRLPRWFSNLLPEDGPLLRFLASQLDLKPTDEVGFLEALGHDLPGALTVGAMDEATTIPLTPRFEEPGPLPPDTDLEPEANVRFSVAGVQLKLSMIRDTNTIRLAGKGEWGNCYVKFPGHYPSMTENEYTMMRLASACGITVPQVRLVAGEEMGTVPEQFNRYRSSKLFVIERFDRPEGGPIQIEDFNQVIDNWPSDKYKGASYEALGRLILRLCGEDDFLEYIRRLAFSLAIGNEDAHLKNWSLYYPDRLSPRLSPAYDFVSTVVYPDLDREMALKLGRGRRARDVTMSTFGRLAEKAGFDRGAVQDCAAATFRALRNAEQEQRPNSVLPDELWAELDAYRQTVPALAELRSKS